MYNVLKLVLLLSAFERIVTWYSKLLLVLSLIILFVFIILVTCLILVPMCV
jgi:hypothetical protein